MSRRHGWDVRKPKKRKLIWGLHQIVFYWPVGNFFIIWHQGQGNEETVVFYSWLFWKMLSNPLCLVGKHCFPCLERSILTPRTGLHIHRVLRQRSTKKNNIFSRRRRKDTASILAQVLVLNGWDLSSLLITQRLVPPFLVETAIVVVALFQWLGKHSLPVASFFQHLFLETGHFLLLVS